MHCTEPKCLIQYARKFHEKNIFILFLYKFFSCFMFLRQNKQQNPTCWAVSDGKSFFFVSLTPSVQTICWRNEKRFNELRKEWNEICDDHKNGCSLALESQLELHWNFYYKLPTRAGHRKNCKQLFASLLFTRGNCGGGRRNFAATFFFCSRKRFFLPQRQSGWMEEEAGVELPLWLTGGRKLYDLIKVETWENAESFSQKTAPSIGET